MKNISLVKWAQWKKKRRNTFLGFIIVGTIVGIDYSFMFTTLYLYLKDLIKTDQPELYYGLIIAIYSVSSSLFGAIFGRWVDRHRRMKLYTNITLTLQIIGCILYIIPINVAFPMVGRLIGGAGDPYTSVCTGEVVRIYDQKEGTSAIWWLAASYSFGFMIGPVVVLFFKHVDFYIYSLHFTQLNAVGLFVAGLLLLVLVIVNFMISDCSAMIDLKMYLKESISSHPDDEANRNHPSKNISHGRINGGVNRNRLSNNVSQDSINIEDITEETCLLEATSGKNIKSYVNENVASNDDEFVNIIDNSINQSNERSTLISRSSWETVPIRTVFRGIFSNADTLLMFISTFLFVYCLFACDVILPLLTEVVLEWSLTSLTMIFVANGLIYFIMIIVSSKYCVTDQSIYKMFIVCITSLILIFVTIILMNVLTRHLVVDIILMTLFVILWALGWLVEEVLIRCTLAKMVPSNCQSFVESLRNGVSRLSMILSSVTAPLTLPYLKEWCTSLLCVNFVLLIAFVRRKTNLQLVREVEFRDKETTSAQQSAFIPNNTSYSTSI